METQHITFNNHEQCKENSAYRKNNVGLLVVFQNKITKTVVIIGTAHFYWDPALDYVKFLQGKIFVEQAALVQQKYNCGVVLCGDFNSMPFSPTLKYMTSQPLGIEGNSEIQREILTLYRPISLVLKNCYENYCDQGFPDFTNYTPDFKETIDHILCTTHFSVECLGKVPGFHELKGIKGLPNEFFPSDHLPLAATFKIN